jgi:hypothetical protein
MAGPGSLLRRGKNSAPPVKSKGSAMTIDDLQHLSEEELENRAGEIAALMATRPKVDSVIIRPLNEITATFRLVGTAPYMQCRFSEKAIEKIKLTHILGQQARSKRTREARDFEQDYESAKHQFTREGPCGIPAPAFRNALISTCRVVGFKMTIAKLSLFIEADGLDYVDKTPLVRIEGEPEISILPVRNATGVIDLRCRPLWNEWAVNLRVRWDADQFSPTDVANLLVRAGRQVGIGEGRPDSRDSNGIMYGLFSVEPGDGKPRTV